MPHLAGVPHLSHGVDESSVLDLGNRRVVRLDDVHAVASQPFEAPVDVAQEVCARPDVAGAVPIRLGVGAPALGSQPKLVVAVAQASPDPVLGEHVVVGRVDEVNAAVQHLVVEGRRGLLGPVVPVGPPKGRPEPEARDLDTRPTQFCGG